jgi:hypothetical protein
MIVNKYIITSAEYEGEVVFGYHPTSKLLYGFYVKAELTAEQHLFFMQHMKPVEDEFKQHFANSNMQVKQIPPDLSFERFWSEYGYKVGNKNKAKDLWNKLSHIDKIKALEGIKIYKLWLSKRHQDMIYAERYISQRRFENEYK